MCPQSQLLGLSLSPVEAEVWEIQQNKRLLIWAHQHPPIILCPRHKEEGGVGAGHRRGSLPPPSPRASLSLTRKTCSTPLRPHLLLGSSPGFRKHPLFPGQGAEGCRMPSQGVPGHRQASLSSFSDLAPVLHSLPTAAPEPPLPLVPPAGLPAFPPRLPAGPGEPGYLL